MKELWKPLLLVVMVGIIATGLVTAVEYLDSKLHTTKEGATATLLPSGCHATTKADRRCTPGATYPGVTMADICTPGWSTAHRSVSLTLKHQVYDLYGITSHVTGEYEIDHLIPLEAGGGNQITNLWPQKQPGAAVKDVMEDQLHAMICSGQWTMRHAWSVIRRQYVQR